MGTSHKVQNLVLCVGCLGQQTLSPNTGQRIRDISPLVSLTCGAPYLKNVVVKEEALSRIPARADSKSIGVAAGSSRRGEHPVCMMFHSNIRFRIFELHSV